MSTKTRSERRSETIVCGGYRAGPKRTPCPRNSVVDRGLWIPDRRSIVERSRIQYDTCPTCTILQRAAIKQYGGVWDDRMGKYGLVYDLLKEAGDFLGPEPSERLIGMSQDPDVPEDVRLISQGILAGRFSGLTDPKLHHASFREARMTALKFLLKTLGSMGVTSDELLAVFEDPETGAPAKNIACILSVDMREEERLGE